MPPSRSLDSSRPRRDPLSCLSCRVKKLRCDRQNPCGNCRSRRLKCEFHGQPNTTTVSPPVSRGEDDLYAQNAELRARMERLERAIFGESPAGVERESKVLSSAHASPAMDQQANGATVDSQWLEGIGTNFVEAVRRKPSFQPPFLYQLKFNTESACLRSPASHHPQRQQLHVQRRLSAESTPGLASKP